MPTEDTVKSVLEFAISREVESYYFYMALTERINDMETKKILEEFAREELGHKERLELELVKRGQTIPVEYDLPPYSPQLIPSNTKSHLEIDYKELLLLAIGKEEASFQVYVDLASKMSDTESRDTLLAIAQEEVKHKLYFEAEYNTLSEQI